MTISNSHYNGLPAIIPDKLNSNLKEAGGNKIIRIVLADDHTVLRDGLAHLLNSEVDFEVVGLAGDGFEAIEKVQKLQPDIVLMDLQMPRLSGVEAIRRLQELPDPVDVIIL